MLRILFSTGLFLLFSMNIFSSVIIENKGQVKSKNPQEEILFYTEGSTRIYFLKDRISYVHYSMERHTIGNTRYVTSPLTQTERVDLIFTENPDPITIEKPASSKTLSNIIYNGLRTNVNSYQKITYKNIAPFIDLVFYEHPEGLKYDIIIKPGGNPADVKFKYKGNINLSIQENQLLIGGETFSIKEMLPRVYMDKKTNNEWIRNDLDIRYELKGTVLSFNGLPSVKEGEILVIDPWATYFGGTDVDECYSIASDPTSGSTYISGFTYSLDLPVTTGIQQDTSAGNYDCFITRYNANGQIEWCTYYGGTSNDFAYGIKVGTDGNPVISGYTYSTDLPMAGTGTHADTLAGSIDLFIAKFSNTGNLIWSTYYGGTGGEFSVGLDIDGNGDILTGGFTSSNNIPLLNPAQNTPGGALDMFAGKFTSNGALVWSTYWGGIDSEDVHTLSFDNAGNAIFGGGTYSNNFPTSAGAYQTSMMGISDCYLIKFDASGNLIWSTLIGGTDNDDINAIGVDIENSIYYAGYSMSSDFPVTPNAEQPNIVAVRDMVIGKFDFNGDLKWSTYYGGSDWDVAKGIAISNEGFIYICGETGSSDFPIEGNAFQGTKAAFYDVAYIVADTGGNFIFSSYKGGNSSENANAITVSNNNVVTIAGNTSSTDFPLLNAFQNTNNGNGEVFVWQMDTTQGVFVGMDENNFSDLEVLLYPNPATDMIIVTGIPDAQSKIEISDNSGKVIYSNVIHIQNNQVSFSSASFTPGIYYLKISNGENIFLKKFVRF